MHTPTPTFLLLTNVNLPAAHPPHHHRTCPQVSYPAKGHASASGVNMEAQPAGFTAREVTLTYWVYFEQDFPWTKGPNNSPPKQVGGK